MSINASKVPNNNTNKNAPEPLDAGTYPGRLVQVIDLGLQKQRPYQGQEKDPAYMIYTTHELSDEFMQDEEGNDIENKPRWISEDFPLHSLNADLAKSTKRYLALDPTTEYKGDWAQLVGAPSMITIIQRPNKDKSRVYNNITGLSTMRAKEASKLPDLVNPAKVFDLDAPDIEIFNSLPEWLQERIKENLNYEGSVLESLLEGGQKSKTTKKQPKVAEDKEEPVEGSTEEEGEDW